MSRRGLSTYVLNIQPLSHLLKGSKGQDPPSHTEKQHRPIVTTVGFWIQYKKIALSLSPPTLPCFCSDLTLSWEKSQDGFLHDSLT